MRSTRAAVLRVARRTGYPVREAWSRRDQGAMGTVVGVMRHHTGTPVRTGMDDYPTLRIVRDGRPGLVNSLCTWGLGRSGTIYCVSERICWHAGEGAWRGITDGNGHFWAVEAESDGRTWTTEQLDAYPRLVASALYELGRGVNWAPRHAQWARPPGRKVDTGGLDEGAFDRAVAGYLANPKTINRNTAPEADVAITDAEFARMRQEFIAALADPTHQYLQDELAPLKAALASAAAQLAALTALVQRAGGLDQAQAHQIALDAAREAVDGITITVRGEPTP